MNGVEVKRLRKSPSLIGLVIGGIVGDLLC